MRWSATAMLVFGVVLFLASVKGKPIGGWHPSQLMTLSACILITWGVLTRPKRKAVIWRDGFVLTGREESPERFYWSRVRHVRFSTAANAIELITDEGRLLDSIAVDFFGSHRRADSFVRAARTWIARHGTSQDPVGL